MFDRITFDPKIMGGRACLRGLRVPVSVIVGQVAHGATFEEILEGYPDLDRQDIQQAIGTLRGWRVRKSALRRMAWGSRLRCPDGESPYAITRLLDRNDDSA